MTLAGTSAVLESAAIARVGRLLQDSPAGDVPRAIGIRTASEPAWLGEARQTIASRSVLFVPCHSVLAIVTALVDWNPAQDSVLVILTDRQDRELDSGILARLTANKLHSISSTTVLDSALGPGYDPRIAQVAWLREALTQLRAANKLRVQTGHGFTLDDAHDEVLIDRIGYRLDDFDQTKLLFELSRPETVQRWKAIHEDERGELTQILVSKFGESARVMLALAHTTEDPLAELLVADVLLREDAAGGGRLYGAFLHSRALNRIAPTDDTVRHAADTAVALVRSQLAGTSVRTPTEPIDIPATLTHADQLLREHAGERFAASSDVLPRAFEQRLIAAAADLTPMTWRHAEAHSEPCADMFARERLDRLGSALRLKQWIERRPKSEVDNVGEGLRRHANELAWVDRAVHHVRGGGDEHPVIAKALYDIGEQARSLRREIDLSFANRLAHSLDRDPGSTLLIENVLRQVVAPLAKQLPVLLIVIDGMSGAVAGELAEHLIDDQHLHWCEAVRADSGQREAVLAALPTETAHSRTSLFHGELTTGSEETEQRSFGKHRFWNRGAGVALFHKKDLPGTGGQQLGAELEAALTGGLDNEGYKRIVGVVLNTVENSLTAGRQSHTMAWSPNDIEHLRALMENARLSQRAVVLLSDHGHVLDHGAERHAMPGSAARWHPGTATLPDEVLLAGRRVLTDGGRGVFAATEHIRYGNKAHGYRGGAALAEIAIPLITLFPSDTPVPKNWHVRPAGTAPQWWKIGDAHVQEPALSKPQAPAAAALCRRTQPSVAQNTLFDSPTAESDNTDVTTLGERLITSRPFPPAHKLVNRAPKPEVFAAVVDALAAANGRRMPTVEVARAAGQANRNPRGLIALLTRVLNRDGYEVLKTLDNGRTVLLDDGLLHEQFLETT